MVPIFALLTIVTCVGIKSVHQRVKRTHTAEAKRIRRIRWRLTEEAF